MSNKQQGSMQGKLALDRRSFLGGSAVACTGAALPMRVLAGGTSPMQAVSVLATPQRAIMHQMAWFDRDGVGEVYDAPHGNQSTREYLDSMSQEAFLRRHWFT